MASQREVSDGYGVIECMKILILAYVVVSILMYIVGLIGDRFRGTAHAGRSVVLLITAHPDDECMFFSPFLLKTTERRPASQVHVLCLTNGNYYGQGKVREKEIIDSCQILGISAENVTVINDSDLPDDPKATWQASSLESHLSTAMDRIQPQQIVTFDGYGVSGHGNHIAVSSAVRRIFQEGNKFKGVEAVYYLESISLWRKYLGIFDFPFTYLFSSHVYLLSPQNILQAQRAMLSHRSQLEWFRILYILFSRYMMVNSFQVEKRVLEKRN